jgi:hypothetical protein
MTESEFARQISALAEAAAKLNAESDTIDRLIVQLHEKLRTMNIGLEAWVKLHSEDSSIAVQGQSTAVTLVTSLGYARGDDGWGLYVKRIAYRPRSSGLPAPLETPEPLKMNKWLKLLDTSRSIRIAALAAFPALFEALKAAAESAVQTIQDSKKIVG